MVEGESDREAAKAVVRSVGKTVEKVVVAGGKSRLDPKIPNYSRAARRSNWVIFRDSDGKCPVVLRSELSAGIAQWSPRLALRIAHSMTEAWLLADRAGFADYFGVKVSQIPRNPEEVAHAKQEVLRLCSNSRSRAIRADMVRSSGENGPLYVKRINEFAAEKWNVHDAAVVSDSLTRAIRQIQALP